MGAPLFPEVVVNGTVIPISVIAAEAQNHAAPASKPGWAWKAAARALAVRELLRQEAARRGLVPVPRDLGGGRRETEEEAAIRLLLEDAITVSAPSEAEIRAAYNAAPERYRAPDLYEAAHILYAALPGDASARAGARGRAEAALAVLVRDAAAFAEIAARESDCPSRDAGGRLGQISEGDVVPEFAHALARLAEGEIAAEPVETRYGFHVVRLDARAEGAVLPYEAVRSRIASAIERARWAAAARAFVAELAAAARIEGVNLESA